MTDRDALLRAVCDDPADDLPRLVFADWLEEHGEPDRAAFIRAQCELEKLPASSPEAVRLVAAHYPLLHRRSWDDLGAAHWWAEVPGPVRFVSLPDYYRRGFRWRVRAPSPREFLDHADELFAAAPVGAVMFDEADPEDLSALTDSPWLRRLECVRLGVDRSPFRDTFAACRAALERFARSPNAEGITELELESGVWVDAAAEVLPGSPLVGRLRRLSVRTFRQEQWLAALTGMGNGARLETTAPGVSPAGELRALAAGLFRTVGELELVGSEFHPGPDAIRALVEAGPFPNLTWLDLTNWSLRDEGVRELAESPAAFPNLQALVLRGNTLTDQAIARLVSAPLARGLTLLHLGRNPVGDAGAAALAAAELPALELLDLSGAEIGPEGRQRLRERFGRRLFPREW